MGDYSRRDFLKQAAAVAAVPLLPALLTATDEAQSRTGLVRPREALFHEKLADGRVRCTLCPKRCTVPPGKRGDCGVRENRAGTYLTFAYANPCAVHIDPIEKKPFFHVLPGSESLSLATAGCNFHCQYCQNWEISQSRPEQTDNFSLGASDIVRLATGNDCRSIAHTYSEPVIFYEYMLEICEQARSHQLLNILHSNGYINPDPLKRLVPRLDCANIDLKAFTDRFYQEVCTGTLAPVLDALRALKAARVWVEITNLIVPTLNDDPKSVRLLARFVRRELGAEVPLHFSRFVPTYRLQNLPPTPVASLETARRTALDEGLDFVYIGNVYGHQAESTFCPKCHRVVIGRRGFVVVENNLKDGHCRFCGRVIPGRWA